MHPQHTAKTCKLHDINPNIYLTDTLQRVNQHPVKDTADLIPRQWKQLFANYLSILSFVGHNLSRHVFLLTTKTVGEQ